MAKVSYIITIYNKAPFIPVVWQSLASQEGDFQKEFIYVNDGSTDNSLELLEDIQKNTSEKVTIITQENQGPAIATNTGLAAATGDYIKIVDGDDCLFPWATRELLACLTEENCSYAVFEDTIDILPAEFSHEGFAKLCDEQRNAAENGQRFLHKDYLSKLIGNTTNNPTSWMASRDVALKYGGCAPHIFIQDYVLELFMATQGPVCITTAPIYASMPVVGSSDDPESRMSAQKFQILHDLNMALAELLRKNPGVINEYGKKIVRRAYARAWRSVKKSDVSFARKLTCFAYYLSSKANLVRPDAAIVEDAARYFRDFAKIRP